MKMDAAALKAAGIVLQTLQPSTVSEDLRAPGEVADDAYGTTLITPRVEALVVRRHVVLKAPDEDGDLVRQALAATLEERFGIEHATIQVEAVACDDGHGHV